MDLEQQLERTLNTQFNVNFEEITQPTKINMWIIIAVIIIIIGIILYKKNQDKQSDSK